ncbi:ABC transporter permease [Rathayibacter sp. VKM Ac-2835]|uniref:ABC transporter permease n=1 Tax=Rathayibacter sp. VKM Ac-2835 TaxID=2739043 RepID=UPI001567347C|nr:ABC transporter permease [Rathayibacter sp. VKM Ac-2835]NRG42945.1 ABC transporter permease [Rathayibacter sp. VKM Ac-2835]
MTLEFTRPEALVAPEPLTRAAHGRGARRARILRLLLRRPGFVLALVFVLFVLASAIAPALFTGVDPTATAPTDKLQAPSLAHLFGTDELGRDLFARVLHGGALTVQATVIALAIALVGGLTLGVVSGSAGGVVDAVIMRIVDVLLAIPGLLLALAIVTAIGFGTLPVALAVGIGILPGFARTTRAEVLRVRTLPYVEAARTGGASRLRVLVRHVLPNSWGPVAVLAVLDLGTAIIAIAALSFLGFGAAPPAAEWGTLISSGRNYLVTSPWLSLLPGLFVGLLVFALNHVAKSLEEVQR